MAAASSPQATTHLLVRHRNGTTTRHTLRALGAPRSSAAAPCGGDGGPPCGSPTGEDWYIVARRRMTDGTSVGIHVHRMICSVFHGPPPSSLHVADHINGNKRDNRAENLRWVTFQENVLRVAGQNKDTMGGDWYSACVAYGYALPLPSTAFLRAWAKADAAAKTVAEPPRRAVAPVPVVPSDAKEEGEVDDENEGDDATASSFESEVEPEEEDLYEDWEGNDVLYAYAQALGAHARTLRPDSRVDAQLLVDSACSRWEGDRPSLRECANFGNVTLALGIAVEGDSLDGMRRDWSMERKVFDGDWSGMLEGALDSPSIIAGVL